MIEKLNHKIPTRYLEVIQDLEKLTNTKIDNASLEKILQNSALGRLSVNSSFKRLTSGKLVRQSNGDGTYSLNIDKWAEEIYSIRDLDQEDSSWVWFTSGGEKYHRTRECDALLKGQNYAQAKGREKYQPQFVSLKDAAFVWGRSPCEICNPPKWEKN